MSIIGKLAEWTQNHKDNLESRPLETLLSNIGIDNVITAKKLQGQNRLVYIFFYTSLTAIATIIGALYLRATLSETWLLLILILAGIAIVLYREKKHWGGPLEAFIQKAQTLHTDGEGTTKEETLAKEVEEKKVNAAHMFVKGMCLDQPIYIDALKNEHRGLFGTALFFAAMLFLSIIAANVMLKSVGWALILSVFASIIMIAGIGLWVNGLIGIWIIRRNIKEVQRRLFRQAMNIAQGKIQAVTPLSKSTELKIPEELKGQIKAQAEALAELKVLAEANVGDNTASDETTAILTEAKKALEENKTALEALKKERDENTQKELERLGAEVVDLKEHLDKANDDNAELQGEKDKLATDSLHWEELYQEEAEKLVELQRLHKFFEEDLEKAQTEVEALKNTAAKQVTIDNNATQPDQEAVSVQGPEKTQEIQISTEEQEEKTTALQEQLTEKEAVITQLGVELTKAGERSQALQEQLTEKEAEITTLKEEKAQGEKEGSQESSTKDNSSLQAKLDAKIEEIKDLQGQLAEKATEMEGLEEDLMKGGQQLSDLQTEMDEMAKSALPDWFVKLETKKQVLVLAIASAIKQGGLIQELQRHQGLATVVRVFQQYAKDNAEEEGVKGAIQEVLDCVSRISKNATTGGILEYTLLATIHGQTK